MGDIARLDDILCEVRERTAGRDNCARFERLSLQLPPIAAGYSSRAARISLMAAA